VLDLQKLRSEIHAQALSQLSDALHVSPKVRALIAMEREQIDVIRSRHFLIRPSIA
jgi:hypothetical protein